MGRGVLNLQIVKF